MPPHADRSDVTSRGYRQDLPEVEWSGLPATSGGWVVSRFR